MFATLKSENRSKFGILEKAKMDETVLVTKFCYLEFEGRLSASLYRIKRDNTKQDRIREVVAVIGFDKPQVTSTANSLQAVPITRKGARGAQIL